MHIRSNKHTYTRNTDSRAHLYGVQVCVQCTPTILTALRHTGSIRSSAYLYITSHARRTPGIPLLTGQVDGYVMTGREVQTGFVYRVAVASRSTVPGYPGRIMLILTVSLTVGVALNRSTDKHTVR